MRNKRKMHNTYNPDLADHTTHRTKPAPDPQQSALRRMCHSYSAGLPPQSLVVLKLQDRLCIDPRIVQQPINPALYCAPTRMPACTAKPPLCPLPCINSNVSLPSNPRRSNSPGTRCLTSACTRSTQASSTCAPRNASPCRPGTTTPSSMHKRKCTYAFSV